MSTNDMIELGLSVDDEQIEALRAEAGEAGDLLHVALCNVALAGVLGEIADVGDQHGALVAMGIIPEHVDADVRARAACATAIRAAQV